MKKSNQSTNANNFSFVEFQIFAINSNQQSVIKGGSDGDIIVQDVVEG